MDSERPWHRLDTDESIPSSDKRWYSFALVGSKKNAKPGDEIDISRHYDGESHYYKGRRYQNPTPEAVGRSLPIQNSNTVTQRDPVGRITQMPQDLARYVSPTHARSFHLMVQATKKASREPQGEWRRTSLQGAGPTIIKVSVWAIGHLGDPLPTKRQDLALMAARVLVLVPPMIVLMLFEFVPTELVSTNSGLVSGQYPIFFGRSWDYPKYPRNAIDSEPEVATPVRWGDSQTKRAAANDHELRVKLYKGAAYDVSGNSDRLIHPRQLIIMKEDGQWELSPGTSQPYIVVSYAYNHFPEELWQQVINIAENMAYQAGVEAYWIDFLCRAEEQPQLTYDVHSLCDVFRGARQVYAAVPNLQLESKQYWGSRMWCLPEALLCSQQKIIFCTPDGSTKEHTKIELAAQIWADGETTTRLLAEHYSGGLSLSRLELITLGLEALSSRRSRSEKLWSQGDVAYALMSLLSYRPRMDPDATLFQALARLSLANDSDRIIERAVCLLPDPRKVHHTPFVLEDALGAKLWDIEPMCQIAGIGENDSVFLDGCQSASIRWKNIPRISFHGKDSWKKRLESAGWQTGPVWFLIGFGLILQARTSKSAAGFGAIFLIVGFVMLLCAPWAVQRKYSGKVWGSTPWLIGFEGVLPLKQIERVFFGNSVGRISYAPSSGLYSERDERERIGIPPAWTEHPNLYGAPELPQGHRWFTLVDTGPSMHVHIFSAITPPSAALICGKEGGMLRVVLCSYEAQGTLLRKETVLRMETPMLSMTKMHNWIRVAQTIDCDANAGLNNGQKF